MASMSTAITLPEGVGKVSIAAVLRLVGLPSERERATTRQLPGSTASVDLVRMIVSVIDDLVSAAIEKRTAEDFKAIRDEVFPQYFGAMRALGDLVRIVAPKHTVERLIAESFCELEADFRDLGPSTFGTDLRDRGIFTVWILRKIDDLAQEIVGTASALSTDKEEEDTSLALKFATYAVWARFHVDCLAKSMRSEKPIYPEVTEVINDGLRAAVNAYAWIRQGVDLRNATPEPEFAPLPWDEEDEALLADSMRDMARESY